ncbi:MAG: hypothetical protein JZU65_09150 [Chlorobium sp.]|nr:hypothetical protein [Chlorobium sp.]
MNFIEEVYAKRKKLADVLADEDYSGIREIVEELYPDKAHFLYELLQNAEDVGATEAIFTLDEKSLRFEHNGRPFDKNDVEGITNIGKGTKKTDEDKIGRFGVGFKAVFAYSETPHIWSPTFSFKIIDLILPVEIQRKQLPEGKTCFEFPFNNPKKSAQDAYEEIKAGFAELAETTLLFLPHLKAIRWLIGKQMAGEVLRIEHTEHHLEVQKQVDGKTTTTSHFLRFTKTVEGLEKQQRIAVAFELDYLSKTTTYSGEKSLSNQMKIIPANPGRVAVFFPAEKETSGLRFHLHAPFVPELSRASIKETPANEPLYRQLSRLAAEALHKIRDLDLLNGEFLGVLPNPQDAIPPRYQSIRTAILDEMKNEKLTPTHTKSYAPAKYLLQAKASLKDFLSEEDLMSLYPDWYEEPPQWAIGASQKNSDQDRFLTGLEITKWDINEFVRRIINSCSFNPRTDFMKWLAAKPLEWHQRLYSLLYKEVVVHDGPDSLKTLPIVRLDTGDYSRASKCYFPSDGGEFEDILPRVAREVYSSGKSQTNQEDAKNFLDQIGVSEIGEAEQVKELLHECYSKETCLKPNLKDINRFISLLERESSQAGVFTNCYIFKKTDGVWGKPSTVYLDLPYLETGLGVYYNSLGENAPRSALSKDYEEEEIPLEKLRKFATAVGVQTSMGETEKIENILKQRYMNNDSFNPDINDMPKFISLLEKEPVQSRIFTGCRIFKKIDGEWGKADEVYLDKPYLETGLRAYYNRRGKDSSRSALSEDYKDSEIPPNDLLWFADAVGVQKFVRDVEQTEAILQNCYTKERFDGDINDMKRFISLLEKDPSQAGIFADYFIFKRVDGSWGKPSTVYLDSPYLCTGLNAYFKVCGGTEPLALANDYYQSDLPIEKLRKFAEAVNVQTLLKIDETTCDRNPKISYLRSVKGERETTPINKDYVISGLNLSHPTIELSRLVWRTMCSLPRNSFPYLATYQKNTTNGAHTADSQLVHQLKTSAWIPQKNGAFVLPSDALRGELLYDFQFYGVYEWLEKIDFGKNAHLKSEEQSKKLESAKELGFPDEQSLSDAKWFAGLAPKERQQFKDDIERKRQVELPDNSPRNPERRAELIGQQATDAPERTTEKRIRSVSIGRDEVKQKAAQYLREQYTDPSDIMICQICKTELPFRLDNGNFYFETVDFLPGLQKLHYQNFLALCPLHRAMFKHANGSNDLMREIFGKMEGNELKLVLAQKDITIYFREKHRFDLQEVVRAELKEES